MQVNETSNIYPKADFSTVSRLLNPATNTPNSLPPTDNFSASSVIYQKNSGMSSPVLFSELGNMLPKSRTASVATGIIAGGALGLLGGFGLKAIGTTLSKAVLLGGGSAIGATIGGLVANSAVSSRNWNLNELKVQENKSQSVVGVIPKDIIVAVIDTGVNISHPELEGKIWTNEKEVPNDGIDNDNNGFTDDSHGWDFIDNNANIKDSLSHGTHIAGTIAGKTVGVSAHAKIMPLRVLGTDAKGNAASISKAIYYAVDNGAKVINLSFGSPDYHAGVEMAILYAKSNNVMVITAAGNNYSNNDLKPNYPASLPHNNVISVANLDKNLNLAKDSNYGKTSVDIAAPGTNIYSSVNEGFFSKYKAISGTSMAAAHVSAIAAEVIAWNPGENIDATRQRILNGDSVEAIKDKTSTGMKVNLQKAVFGNSALLKAS